jgi:hypothetical protein
MNLGTLQSGVGLRLPQSDFEIRLTGDVPVVTAVVPGPLQHPGLAVVHPQGRRHRRLPDQDVLAGGVGARLVLEGAYRLARVVADGQFDSVLGDGA